LLLKTFFDPVPEKVNKFKAKLLENGIQTWVRPPVFHLAPPLIITEQELNTAFDKVDDALKVLDH
jgi:4-aminobutyrate aminotransferase-like enzyme